MNICPRDPKRCHQCPPGHQPPQTKSEMPIAHGKHSCREDGEAAHVLHVKDSSLTAIEKAPPGLCMPCKNTPVLQDGRDTSLCVRNGTESPCLSPETGWDSPTTQHPPTITFHQNIFWRCLVSGKHGYNLQLIRADIRV